LRSGDAVEVAERPGIDQVACESKELGVEVVRDEAARKRGLTTKVT